MIALSTTYNTSMLYDYGGSLFRHINSKLVQNEIVDADGTTLIPPWEEYEKLRPGTLVIATVSLHAYVMKVKDRDGNETGKDRRVCLRLFIHLFTVLMFYFTGVSTSLP